MKKSTIGGFLLALSLLYFPLESIAYTLIVKPYGGTDLMEKTGVAIQVYNDYTGYSDERWFENLPPSEIPMYFTDDQMPIGEKFLICAYYADNREQISCETYHAGESQRESASIDLSPWN